MSDDRDYPERSISLSEATDGVKPTPEALANTLLLHSQAKRGAILDQIKADLKDKHLTARQAADHLGYERALWDAHRKALAVGK